LRILVYALVLLNLGFWSWRAWFAPQAPEPERFDGPSLTLLKEVEQAPVSTPAPAPVPESGQETEPEPQSDVIAEAAPVTRCVAIGPFAATDDRNLAESLLADAGFDLTARTETQEIWDGYWVYVGQLPDMAAAREALATIEAEGIEDAYIIQNSDSGILISLGVYSDLARASTLANRAGELDLDVTVTDRTRTVQATWFEFEQLATDPSATELLQQQFADGVEQRDCAPTL